MSARFVLLDRDGTINEDVDHLLDPAQVRLIPGAAEAIRMLRDLGLGIVVVTNQSPVGRGWISMTELDAIHARLVDQLMRRGATIDGIYACPHGPEAGCACRKPATGLALRAAAEHGFDPSQSFVVGDHRGDMELGRALGATSILLLTGHGRQELEHGAGEVADAVVADLPAAAEVIRSMVANGAAP